jgi:cholesterol oxidase
MARSLHSLHFLKGRLGVTLPLNASGLLEIHQFGGISVLGGAGVGGSSLVYAGLSQRPPDDFFDAFPQEITPAEMEPYFRSLEAVLEPTICPTQLDRTLALEKAAAGMSRTQFGRLKQAIQWGAGPDEDRVFENRWGVKQQNCNFCSNCTPGCNRGAKNSLDLNLIPSAAKAGARVQDGCAVDFIRKVDPGYEVVYRDRRARVRQSLRAPRVVVAAGTLNTHKILFRSRAFSDGLPRLSPMLGKAFSLGGDALRFYRKRSFDFDYGRSHQIDGMLEVLNEEGRRDHFVFPADLILPRSRLWRRASANRTLSLTGFGRDGADGRLTWSGRNLRLAMPEQAVIGRIYASMFSLAHGYGQQGGGTPIHASDATPSPRKPQMSAHPMGGCRMSDNIESGVIDHRGEVFGYPGLYVADASIFAAPPVCAPSLSIGAMAWRISQLMIEPHRRGV